MTTPEQVYHAVFEFLTRQNRVPTLIPAAAISVQADMASTLIARTGQTGPQIEPPLGDLDERRRRRAAGDKDDGVSVVRPSWVAFTTGPTPPVPDIDPPFVPPAPIIPPDPPVHGNPPGGGGPGGGIAGLGFIPLPLVPDLAQRLAQPVIIAPVDRESFEDYFTNQTIESFWRLPAGSSVTEDETGSTMTTGSRMMIDKRSFSDCEATVRIGTVAPESEDTLLVRATLSGALSGYGLRQSEASGSMQLLRIDGGIETVLNTYPGEAFGSGDTMTLAVQGGDIAVYHNAALIDSFFDGTYTDGYVGMYTPGLSASTLTYFAVSPL